METVQDIEMRLPEDQLPVDFYFYRSELRVLQNSYADNEKFLKALALQITKLEADKESANTRASLAEDKLRRLVNGVDSIEDIYGA